MHMFTRDSLIVYKYYCTISTICVGIPNVWETISKFTAISFQSLLQFGKRSRLI